VWHECFERIPAAIMAASLAALPAAQAQDDDDPSSQLIEVTVTNLTRGQQFTPILLASHRAEVRLFELGEPASPGLQTLAEEGNVAPLTEALRALPGVLAVTSSTGLLDPGASVTIRVETHGAFDHVSLAAMLIPTNDGFFAVNGARVPHSSREPNALTSVAYDAGSERNDELCSSIPGPFFVECGGPGGGAATSGDEEGYVHVHAGIHGIGDLDAAERDWRNPVAHIRIRHVR
jgi:Spondin_N